MEGRSKAILAWTALAAILVIRKEAADSVSMANSLRKAPKLHVIAAQFILLGSGYATAELEPDGDYGSQTNMSMSALYDAVKKL